MELKLPSTAGWRPPKKKMMFLPKVSSCFRFPLRKPSPTPTSSRSDPTPQAIPNMVRNERNLWAHSVRHGCEMVSDKVRMPIARGEPLSWTSGREKGHPLFLCRRHIAAENTVGFTQLLTVNLSGGTVSQPPRLPPGTV